MKKDNIMPNKKWEFDEEVTQVFENMLERSIPYYEVMRKSSAKLIYDVIQNKEHFKILDIGCSDGLMIVELLKMFKSRGTFIGVDVSEPMLKRALERVSVFNAVEPGRVNIFNCDLRYNFPHDSYDAITSILSLQFIPIEYRQKILTNIYNDLLDGGCFIMVEKVLGNSTILDDIFVKNYYQMKSDNGYSQEQIERKRLSLEGVMVPITNDWNVELLRQAGFKQIDSFWRWMNFVGYIAVK